MDVETVNTIFVFDFCASIDVLESILHLAGGAMGLASCRLSLRLKQTVDRPSYAKLKPCERKEEEMRRKDN